MTNGGVSNVIPMRELEPPVSTTQEAQFERLLKECQGLGAERLSKSLSSMLDKVEETLWGLADQTAERELRDLYIKAKDKALEQRRSIEEKFRNNYLDEFARRVRPERKQRDDFSHFDLSALELGLVNDEDLEETIKVNEMAAKLRRYCEEELNALDQRVGVLIGDANLQGEGNPFSPQAICTAYKQTCRQIEPNLKVRMIFHKLFDDHVLDDVRSIYKDLNALLIQRSILPKIRYGIRRQAGRLGVRPAMPSPAMPGTAIPVMGLPMDAVPEPGYGTEAPGTAGEQDFYAVLQGLVAMSAHAGQFAAPSPSGSGMPAGSLLGGGTGIGAAGGPLQASGLPPVPGGHSAPAGIHPRLQGAELIGSLTRLQQGDFGAIAGAPVALDASALNAGTTNVVRELKSTRIGNSLDQADATTMDIVAMLFDQIFSDKRVPYALKVLIGRLQIPVVKVAVLDKKFFSKKSHPARRLLDTLGEFALGLDESFDQNSAVYKKLGDIVQRLLDAFDDDVEVFENLNEDLLALVRDENQRAEDAAKEAARKIAYMERLEVGKALAQFEIKKRAEATRISQLVLSFLASEWVKLLLLAYARHGNDSEAWKSGLETMDLLIWSVNHKPSVDERRKLAAMLPGLLKRLQAGLKGAGADPERRRLFFARLMRLHTKVISGNAAVKAAARPIGAPTLTDVVSPAPDTPSAPTRVLSPLPGEDSLRTRPPGAQPAALSKSAADRSSVGASQADSVHGTAPDHHIVAPAIPPMGAHAIEGETGASEIDHDAEPATEAPRFSNVTIKNPFGDGEIEIEEISLSDLPGIPELSGALRPDASQAEPVDQQSRSVTNLKEGDWLEFRDADERRTQARLSYISPLKGTYLFVNRQGTKVGEYSLYQLAREFRTGSAVLLETVPLLDRAMSGLVGMLRKSAH